MKQWTRVRHKVLRDKQSKRSVMREEGLHWETLGKMLAYSQPPGYRRKKRRERKIDPYVGWIEEVLKADRNVPKKQRHTAKRIYQRLGREKGYQGGYTAVKEVVAELRARRREVFVPLEHRPGEGQVDFGHALVKEAGQLRRRPFFAMSLPYSDAFFVQVFERECTESFWEGHLRAFEFLGAVPRRISYDNSKVAVGKIIGSRERKLTDGFLQLQSHYLFEEHFCLPARPNEKGVVEGIVRYARANFLVPVPQVRDLEELNAKLLEACERDMERKLRGKRAVKKELLAEERAVMLALPPIPFEASRKRSTCVSSLSLVRFECNDYSVPVRCAHHPVVVEGSCRQVVIFCGGQEVARHRRIWDKEQVSFEPVHYLALLEKKPAALDFARPLSGWQLPQCLQVLRRRLESQCGGEGTREYIRVLRLLEKHPMAALQQAVVSALRVGGLTREAIAQYLYPQEDYGSRTFRLDGHPHLRHVRVAAPDLGAYSELLKIPGGAL